MTSLKCPICKKSTTESFKPFCSKRCADVDLNRWLSDVYRVETEEPQSVPTDTDEEQ